ncbi:hypothetical protein [Klebsiella pneumoniae]|uniref:hypothetical protein n=1 Tax=Klebsiella pneumoniae TaxID=573 RepID=UPI0029CAC214|nr:hypothetical protein [Klebsiella pneumoniae]WPI89056.1 hypothetical protein R8540_26065 [Klebsiella pneumoniae]WPI99989.1 hypothetical protein R8553_26065 [Klebsiella pneumoniae]
MNSFLHQASFATGYWCYDRHRSVRLVVLVGLAIDQIAQSGLSSLSVIYYSAQLFRLFGAQIILIALWNLIFTVVLPDEKARTILGFDLYNISSYLLYGMTVLLGIGSVAMLFNKNNS